METEGHDGTARDSTEMQQTNTQQRRTAGGARRSTTLAERRSPQQAARSRQGRGIGQVDARGTVGRAACTLVGDSDALAGELAADQLVQHELREVLRSDGP